MKYIILIEDDSFIKRFRRKLESWSLDNEYDLIVIDPPLIEDDEEEDYPIEPIIESVSKTVITNEVSLILVDIEIFPDLKDKYGIRIAESIKLKHPRIPVLNITYHYSEEALTGIFSQAVLSVNDGVLPKSFFTQLDRQSFEKFIKKLSKKINHADDSYKTKESTAYNKKSSVDYAIISALYEDEFENLIRVFELNKNQRIKLGDKEVFSNQISTRNKSKNVIAIYQSNVGRVDAGTLTTELIKEFHPKYIIMCGVCGGEERTNLGDVIIAKFVFTFDKGKFSDKGFFRELEFVKTDDSLLRIIRENKVEILKNLKKTHLDNEEYFEKHKQFNTNNIEAIIDPMACSPAVIDKENYFNEVIKMVDRKATAVEMESYGVARAAEISNSGKTRSLIIKSVMDNTVKKDDRAKSYASYTSALFARSLIELDILP